MSLPWFLTGILFLLSLTAGLYGFQWGNNLGEDALFGVRQPNSQSSSLRRGQNSQSEEQTSTQPSSFLSEADIVQRVSDQKVQNSGFVSAQTSPESASTQSLAESSAATPEGSFPYEVQSQGVYLKVQSLSVNQETLTLNLSLQNEGTEPVRFLYRFLTLTDNRGQVLSSSVEGLPSELPALSQTFRGTVRVPRIAAEELRSVSLSLTDYPNQVVQLALEDIPVAP